MTEFLYKARAAAGTITEGVFEAPDQRTAMDRLRAQRLIVLEISERAPGLLDGLKKFNPFGPKVTSKDIVLFSRQLSTLVSAGVALVAGLNILSEQIESKPFKAVVVKVKEDIEGGLSIAEALKKHPSAFSDLYVAMVKAGEVGGILDTILERLSAYLEAAEDLKHKVKAR